MTMYNTYSSMVGMVNLIFTFAMAVLAGACFQNKWYMMFVFACLGILYFPLFQPLIIYFRLKKNLKDAKEICLSFTDTVIYVTVGEQHEEIMWDSIRSVEKKPRQIALYTDSRRGYVIPDDAMGDKKNAFFQFAGDIINRQKKDGREAKRSAH